MPTIPHPSSLVANETVRRRVESLHTLDLLNAPSHEFDDLVELAAMICHKPMGAMTLLDESTQTMTSRYGLKGSRTFPVSESICQYTVGEAKDLVVNDTALDPRFCDSETLLRAGGIRFYAGTPLMTTDGQALGALCVMDTKPAELNGEEERALRIIGRQISARIQLRERAVELAKTQEELGEANRKLTTLALTDELTGLWNRRAFDLELTAAFATAKRTGRPLSLLLLDVDRFKDVNDAHGHGFGDTVLAEVSAVLQRCKRIHDTASRYGGEEFAIIVRDSDLAGGVCQAKRIIDAFHAWAWKREPVTASIGVAERLVDGDTPMLLIARADAALYSAKRGGRDRYASQVS